MKFFLYLTSSFLFCSVTNQSILTIFYFCIFLIPQHFIRFIHNIAPASLCAHTYTEQSKAGYHSCGGHAEEFFAYAVIKELNHFCILIFFCVFFFEQPLIPSFNYQLLKQFFRWLKIIEPVICFQTFYQLICFFSELFFCPGTAFCAVFFVFIHEFPIFS